MVDAVELGMISFYLAKRGITFETALRAFSTTTTYEIRDFEVDGVKAKFIYFRSDKPKSNPPWLNFVNEHMDDEKKIRFSTRSQRPNGLLLLEVKDRVLAATFGHSSPGLLNRLNFHHDFGIITAMNMCGNQELRQFKTRTHAITTQHIDRQVSQPADSTSFGMNETEFLKYISGHVAEKEHITLQGKDSLSIKVIGKEKLSWERLIEHAEEFISQYKKETYKSLFPNYLNLQPVEDSKIEKLDELLLGKLKKADFENIHLAIPQFLQDDEYQFCYSKRAKQENEIFSYIDILHFKSFFSTADLSIEKLKNKFIYAYSPNDDEILSYKKWSIYDCLVAEFEYKKSYYVLSDSIWQTVDSDFYQTVEDFVAALPEDIIPNVYHNFDIFDSTKGQNLEGAFNAEYCKENKSAIKFDQAKLKIGQSKKDKEFCDVLALNEGKIAIVQVKRISGSSSMNHLFSQARVYCEFFITDHVFLKDIRKYIQDSSHPQKQKFLDYIKEDLRHLSGADYDVCLWLLYCNKMPQKPKKESLPLMTKYELKLTHDRLRNIYKFNSVKLGFVPVKITPFTKKKKTKIRKKAA